MTGPPPGIVKSLLGNTPLGGCGRAAELVCWGDRFRCRGRLPSGQGGAMSTSVGTESEAQATGKTGGWLAVEVSRHVSAPLAHVWEVLVSPEGSSALLGDGAVLGGKGEPYHCVDGTSGVLR